MTWEILPVGLVMMALTVMLHTVGVVFWLTRLGARIEYLESINKHVNLFRGVWTTSLALLVLHILEAVLWALLYMVLLYAVIQKCWKISHDHKAARPKTQKPR